MGFGDFLDDIGDAIEKGVEDGIEGLGQLAESTLDALGDGADAIGLDSLGEGLDDLGDNIASATGGDVDERELGETEDPKELIRGEPSEIGSTAQTLRKMAGALESTGQALKKIDAADWVGQGADAFNEVYDKQPRLWFDGADAMTAAADAMDAWLNEVKTAQAKAADAIDKWKAADAEERRQKTWWNSLSGEQQANTPLVDTWTSMRREARDILRGARTQRDNGASIAVSAFAAAAEKAPKEPPFHERLIANLSDLGGVIQHGQFDFVTGLLTSFTGLVQFVRQINPTDIYNLTHPAEYAAGLSNLGTGLVVAVADPGAAVSAILSDARRNPFEFAGALTGDALLTVVTGGGGSAKVAISALRRSADAGRTALRLADDAGDLGRRLPTDTPGRPGSNPSAGAPNSSAGPAPNTGHTPTGTNPVDAGSRPEAPSPNGDNGSNSSSSPEQPRPRADADPPPQHAYPDPDPSPRVDPDSPPQRSDPDLQPTPRTEPDVSPARETVPDFPAPRTEPDVSPARETVPDFPAPRTEPDVSPARETVPDFHPPRTESDPPERRTDSAPHPHPNSDSVPPVRTDPDHSPDVRTDDTPTSRTVPDTTPTTRTDATPTPGMHGSPGSHIGSPSPRMNPDATPSAHPQPDSPARPAPATRTPDATPLTRAHPDPTPAARSHSDPAAAAGPHRDPVPAVRAEPHSSPAARIQPGSPSPARPTSDHTPQRTHADPPTRTDPDGPSRRSDPDPGRRPDDDPNSKLTQRDPERSPDRDEAGSRDPDDSRTDRDAPRERDSKPDGDSDAPTPQDRTYADRNAHQHTRDSGAETDRTAEQKTCSKDPVDISTGEFLLPEVDIELPGVLGLVLRRAHHSNHRFGRWFGPSWSATLDVRIVVVDEGVTFIGEDGIMLAYPHAEVGVPVHPLSEGQRWSLIRTDSGGYRVWDQRRELIWHFAPELGLDGIEARLGNYAISAITDRHHNRVRFHYDADGVPVEVTHSGGYRVRIHSHRGRVTGLSLVTEDSHIGEFATPVREFAYQAGDLVAVTDADGATTRFTYDAEHRMTSWIDSNGNQMVNTYDESGRVVFQRGTAGMLNSDYDYLQLPDGSGRLTTVTDSLGATTQHGFDHELQLRDLIDPAGGRTHIDRNADRRPLIVTGPDGAATTYVYNGAGDPTKITSPDGNSTEIEYIWRNRPITVTAPDGSVSRREWTEDGDLSAIVDPAGTRTEFTYHSNGALAAIVEANGARTTVQVDAAGLPIGITDARGGVTRIGRDAAGRPTRVTDALGAVTHYHWSSNGKLLRRTDPDGHAESWTYDGEGNIRTHTDRAGGVTRFTYGAFDLLRSRTEPDGSVTRYTWDTERRLTAVHNPIGQSWTYDYDNAGRLIAETDYTGATTRYTYDRAGRVATITPATGVTRRHHHDILGRLTEITTGEEWIRYTHDPLGRVLTAANGIGEYPTHTLEFTYTATGSIASEQLDAQSPMLYEHDQLGRRIRRTTPTGAVTTWHHDILGRPVHLRADDHDVTFDYDPLGRLAGWSTGEIAVTRSLTDIGRVTHQEVTAFPARALSLDLSARPAPRQLRRDEFTYRPDGYLTAHITARPDADALQRAYHLDPVGRVTAVLHNDSPTERYSYDALSNITSALSAELPQVTHEEVPPAPAGIPQRAESHSQWREYRNNLLIRDGRTRYHYDESGRLVRKTRTRLSRKSETWFFRYNSFDQLTDVWTPDRQWWHYTYDALGRRTTKQRLSTDDTVLERVDYTWDGTQLLEQAAAAIIRWQYEPDSYTPITQMTDQEGVDREFYVIVTDLVGTPVEMIDPGSAHIAATANADLWGNASWHGHASTSLRFPGQIHDPETGLHYNLHRTYDPATGRFLTQDPLGLAPAPNPHGYPHNPTIWSDPQGLLPKRCRVTVSPVVSDWATKGAHVHIEGMEAVVFPHGDGTVGVKPWRLSHGEPTEAQMQHVLDELRSNPALRADLIEKARAAMSEMNSHNWGYEKNRALEMHYLIRALEKMG
ncbi:putative T7SS-secreted protein [Nocardia abscessus]|uniref:putative T7SS-secreted protein n=1 Tax=Nocardia abscessus TaxID=120957 RepID=UPI0002FD8CA6|nr:RHS repeat-associated core domain-containing protein [Nocardia abscessus]MCC3330934.1 DUF6531 domain-containing protein [Nocardia abscessus]